MLESKKEYLRWQAANLQETNIVQELQEIQEDESAIADRFSRHLSFGTGGLRGVMGAGTSRMNVYTVRKATQGFGDYLIEKFKNPSIAIAYDTRNNSQLFAKTAAQTLAAMGIVVYLFDTAVPTPMLSFAVRELNCSGGIVITASHNPAKYNGYKVYGADGCQITDEAAEIILKKIQNRQLFELDGESLPQDIILLGEEMKEKFYASVLQRRIESAVPSEISIVYTPLHGTGLIPVTSVLKKAGYNTVTLVENQALPDGNFPTCPSPNPETPQALEQGLAVCEKVGADLLLATDPDCDRVGIAVKNWQTYSLLTGNEVGVLLLDYICKRRLENGTMPPNAVAVKTIVTTHMAHKIANTYGVQLVDLLTGFKYIGEHIALLEKAGETNRYIFGFEESYGYLSGTQVRDKDAVDASLLICDMASWHHKQGISLFTAMENLYKKYGYCIDALSSYTFEGEKGLQIIKKAMYLLRKEIPKAINDAKVTKSIDYLLPTDGISLPKSDVLQLVLEDESLLTIRPSGTEPKIKLYCSVTREEKKQAQEVLIQYQEWFENFLKKIE